MIHARTTSTVALLIILAVLPACSSKKDKADQVKSQQQTMSSASKASGPAQAKVAVSASPQDEADAAILKKKVLSQVKAGEFSAIYREASAGFREVGPEEQFTGLWEQQLKLTGALKESKEISHSVRPQDKFIVFIYHAQYDKAKKELQLTFGRSKKGKMELTGINQREI